MSKKNKKDPYFVDGLKKDFYKKRRIETILRVLSQKRGRRSENLVEKALESLKEKKEIRGFVRFEPYSRQDRMGIDFRVRRLDGKPVLIQVKSSMGGAREFQRRSRGKGDRIFIVIVESGDNIKTVSEKIRKVCGIN